MLHARRQFNRLCISPVEVAVSGAAEAELKSVIEIDDFEGFRKNAPATQK